jgi:hypothetical protein
MMDAERVRDARAVEYGELPELTRALRALGSSRGGGASMQAGFFQALLDARRRAADARSPESRVRAFDAAELQRSLERTIDRIVTDWPDKRESARRALRAELNERVALYRSALIELGLRGPAATPKDEATRLAAWRAWTVQLAVAFDAADRSWVALRSVVEALSTRPPR